MRKKSFLSLDIGNFAVRGFGLTSDGLSLQTTLHSENSGLSIDENIINTIDAIEQKLNVKFKDVFVTGNFGIVETIAGRNTLSFGKLKNITNTDVYNAICNANILQDVNGKIAHLIPIQFLINNEYEVKDTTNAMGNSLSVLFNAISFPDEIIAILNKLLLGIGIKPAGFFDPIYILGQRYHEQGRTEIFIDFGKTKTSIGVVKDRGLLERFDIDLGQFEITKAISETFNIDLNISEIIKLKALGAAPEDTDEYIIIDANYPDITKFYIWETWTKINNEILDRIYQKIKTEKSHIFITGSGTNPENINSLILENKGLEKITLLDEFAIVGSLAKLSDQGIAVKKNQKILMKNVPILPSVMLWNINNAYIYKMFESAQIKEIHFDVMDGFYTKKVMGSIEDLKKIKKFTALKIQVHLMVEDSMLWIEEIAKIGVDSIILSSGTRRILEAIEKIKSLGIKAGIALHPEFDIKNLNQKILKTLDEIIVMTVIPGESGQKFIPEMLPKIKILSNSKKHYGFKYKIFADGGINNETAKLCWKNGADAIISGSFLKVATDFREGVRSLLYK